MFCEEIKHRMCYTVYKLTATIALNVIKKKRRRRRSGKPNEPKARVQKS